MRNRSSAYSLLIFGMMNSLLSFGVVVMSVNMKFFIIFFFNESYKIKFFKEWCTHVVHCYLLLWILANAKLVKPDLAKQNRLKLSNSKKAGGSKSSISACSHKKPTLMVISFKSQMAHMAPKIFIILPYFFQLLGWAKVCKFLVLYMTFPSIFLKEMTFRGTHKLRRKARGLAKCLCYFISWCSKLVYGGWGEGGFKNLSNSCLRR